MTVRGKDRQAVTPLAPGDQTLAATAVPLPSGLRRAWQTGKWRRWVPVVATHAVLLVGAVFILAPALWMLSTSLKDVSHLFDYPPQWIPDPVRWDNYVKALTALPFGRYFLNTAFVTIMSTVGSIGSSLLIAYGFARLRFPGREFLFYTVLATMMLPGQVTMVPTFILFRSLHWVDTYLPLFVPLYFGRPFFIFLLRQFFLTVPKDLDEAARIDGCNSFQILSRILLPQIKPALAALAIFSFMWSWDDFMNPLIYINSSDKWTLALALNGFQSPLDPGMPVLHLVMAASVVVALPAIIIFFLAQRFFIEGVVISGIKG
ncbi:MAG: carbohydrate ABC transporter permease [Limnochordaceae bacterium]|nr:carbohydrate ABC transporter permease [Limnochordaceae bacterium]